MNKTEQEQNKENQNKQTRKIKTEHKTKKTTIK